MTFKYIVQAALVFGCFALAAQNNTLPPAATEVWEPEPRVVTPGVDNGAPSDAIVLFNGNATAEWESVNNGGPIEWKVEEGAMTVVKGKGGIKTKRKFNDFQLHIEWRTPSEVVGNSQGRGNSGIFLQEIYEVQVLDSYMNRTYSNGQAGSIYKQHIPLVNACKPPGEWQTYDIIYSAPHFNQDGMVIKPAKVTVLQNGILVQNGIELKGPTEYIGIPKYKAHGAGGIMLQDHGNPVSFRNIWIREL